MSQDLRETEKELRDLCRTYALDVCNGKMMFYNSDGDGDPPYEAYDIKYTVDGDGTYLGVRILLAGGGPNVYLDTYHEEIQGYWGGDSCKLIISDYDYIDDYWQEMYGCLKSQ
jgi:hypothetical protein